MCLLLHYKAKCFILGHLHSFSSVSYLFKFQVQREKKETTISLTQHRNNSMQEMHHAVCTQNTLLKVQLHTALEKYE